MEKQLSDQKGKSPDADPELRFDHNVIEHLGIKLYQNKPVNVLACPSSEHLAQLAA
ncbi:hypothetical protein BV97_01199 [Novosphingobium resinovorum]|uniref:Uncharacterized protein n=1 Tax=Novosphingobium resinovorum TaxID=158500 RepID=A0A031JZC7_9SPHN|nr:hypothetical protein [Novosphingobium resinovorum]EZP83096.1 hypothetical protein BV97_01199 [Novosphingobium resinovorum]